MKTSHLLAICMLMLAIGFGLGRWAMPQHEARVEYVSLPPIKGSLREAELRPLASNLGHSLRFIPIYINKAAPLEQESSEVPVIDTLASYRTTVADWNTERLYGSTLFDTPELGTLSWNGSVQYNTMTAFDWSYTPVKQVETVVKRRRVVEPFVRLSYSSFGQLTIGGGIYYKNVGLEVLYITSSIDGRKGLGGAVSFKF